MTAKQFASIGAPTWFDIAEACEKAIAFFPSSVLVEGMLKIDT